MKRALFAPWLALIVAIPVSLAQVRPMPGEGDPRLQSVAYDPNQIVQLSVAQGYQLMVSFAPGEHIETIAVGDSAAWQVTANKRGDYLFIKNVQSADNSNLTVVTDARVYAFELVRAFGAGGDLPYAVRFTYADARQVATAPPIDEDSYRYRVSGSRTIRPSALGNEGNRTIIEWPDKAAIPAIFRIDDDGQETLVNSEMQGDRFVIEGIQNRLVFRLDRLTAKAERVSANGKRR
jgi:type IV secretion system protein VirB9